MLGAKETPEAKQALDAFLGVKAPRQPVAVSDLSVHDMDPLDKDAIAKGFGTNTTAAGRFLSSGGALNLVGTVYLENHGFTAEDEKGGGFIMTDNADGAKFKVRACVSKVELGKSGNRGMKRDHNKVTQVEQITEFDGFALLFSRGLPERGRIYFISHNFVRHLVEKGYLDAKWNGDAVKLVDYLEQVAASL